MADDDRGRPGNKAPHRSNYGPSSIPPAGDNPAIETTDNPAIETTDNTEPDGYADWAVVFHAESAVLFELHAIAALRALTTDQLRSLIWVGLLDEGWTRLYAELDERGWEL